MEGDRDLGLFPLDMVLLPAERAAVHIFEPRYRQLVADTTLESRPFALVRNVGGSAARVGCAAHFAALVRRFADGRMSLMAQGEQPVELIEETHGRLYLSALVRPLADEDPDADGVRLVRAESAFRTVTGIEGALPAAPGIPRSYALAASVDLPVETKQALLDSRVENDRLDLLVEALDAAESGQRHAALAAARASTNGRVSNP